MSDIEVSVICAAYNQEQYIRLTLDSLVNQKTDFKYEIIVHDDASTDQTGKIIKEFEERYPDKIRAIYETENQYSKMCFLCGHLVYPLAKGRYYAFCEGDDYWIDEYKLQKQYDVMEAHKEVTICTHCVKCVDENGEDLNETRPDLYVKPENDTLFTQEETANQIWGFGGYRFQTTSYLIRREIVDMFVQNLDKYEGMNDDNVLVRLAFLQGKMYYINQTMSCWRRWNSHYNRERKGREIKNIYNHNIVDIFICSLANEKYRAIISKEIISNMIIISKTRPDLSHKMLMKLEKVTNIKVRNLPSEYKSNYRFIKYCPNLLKLYNTSKIKKYTRYWNRIICDRDAKLVMWGTGTTTRKLIANYGDDLNISFYVDNNIKKQNSEISGVKIYAPAMIKNINEKKYILITSVYTKDIIKQIRKEKLCKTSDIVKVCDINSWIQLYD